MKDIKLVIKIDEEIYKNIIENGFIYDEDNEYVTKSIKKSTPLPKGHGRLIDTNELIENGVATESYLNTFIKTIIEADKEEEDESVS